jgi:hypothetical protein
MKMAKANAQVDQVDAVEVEVARSIGPRSRKPLGLLRRVRVRHWQDRDGGGWNVRGV